MASGTVYHLPRRTYATSQSQTHARAPATANVFHAFRPVVRRRAVAASAVVNRSTRYAPDSADHSVDPVVASVVRLRRSCHWHSAIDRVSRRRALRLCSAGRAIAADVRIRCRGAGVAEFDARQSEFRGENGSEYAAIWFT